MFTSYSILPPHHFCAQHSTEKIGDNHLCKEGSYGSWYQDRLRLFLDNPDYSLESLTNHALFALKCNDDRITSWLRLVYVEWHEFYDPLFKMYSNNELVILSKKIQTHMNKMNPSVKDWRNACCHEMTISNIGGSPLITLVNITKGKRTLRKLNLLKIVQKTYDLVKALEKFANSCDQYGNLKPGVVPAPYPKLCFYGVECNKLNCREGHPERVPPTPPIAGGGAPPGAGGGGPPAAGGGGDIGEKCPDDLKCSDLKCNKGHTHSVCPDITRCMSFSCEKRHPKSRTWCCFKGDACPKKDTCTCLHPDPPSAAGGGGGGDISEKCPDDLKCSDLKCNKEHTHPVCLDKSRCKSFSCKKRHPKNRTWCCFQGKKCRKGTKCRYLHPETETKKSD